jgi:phosphohistidine phosphatase
LLTLILLRHAKSDWEAKYDSDHERPLAKRGKKDSDLMGKLLSGAKEKPDLILSSSSVRTTETIKMVLKHTKWECQVNYINELFESTPAKVISMLQEQADSAKTIVLVGHEPEWSLLMGKLIGGGNVRFPTAAAACINFEVNKWSDIKEGMGELEWFVIPKLLKRADLD